MSDLFSKSPVITSPDISTTFGGHGVATWNRLRETDSSDSPAAMMMMDDGRIWITGYGSGSGSFGFLKSYNSDGSLDATFGYQQGGVMAVNSDTIFQTYPASLAQFGEYVYVAGQYTPGSENIFLMRFNSDGSYDLNFNKTGMVTFDFSGSDYVLDMKVQTDGKVLVAGQSNDGYYVIRVNPDGSLDSGFGTAGIFAAEFNPGSSYDELRKVLLQSDGKIVLLGSSTNGTKKIAMMRLTTSGALDATFGTGGKATASASTPNDIFDGRILSNGNIIVVGNNNDDVIVARFTSAGALDTTFNTTGYIVRDFTADEENILALEVQDDGKILVAGSAGSMMASQAFVARLNADGSTDTSFNSTGFKMFEFVTGEVAHINQIKALTSGGYLLYGGTYDMGNSKGSTVLMQLTSTGAADTSFHNSGDKFVNIGQLTEDFLYNYKILESGKFLAVGETTDSNGVDGLIVRFNPNGAVDTTFGTSGMVLVDSGQTGGGQKIFDVIERPDGKLVALLSYMDPSFNRATRVLQYSEAGVLDTTFNGTGYVDFNFSEDNFDPMTMVLDENGKVLVGGATMGFGDSAMAMARINLDGTLDTTFATGGKFESDLTVGYDSISAIKIQDDGKIIVGGSNGDDVQLLRLLDSGALDPSFATAGIYQGNPLAGTDYYWTNEIHLIGNKILLFNNYSAMGGGQVFLQQFNADGTVDTSFGTSGIVSYASEYTKANLRGIYPETDGKFTLAFSTEDGDAAPYLDIRRINADGSFDTSFNSGNPLPIYVPLASYESFANNIQRFTNGKYLLGGTINLVSGDFIFVRFSENGVE
jgi:hypothetical protein